MGWWVMAVVSVGTETEGLMSVAWLVIIVGMIMLLVVSLGPVWQGESVLVLMVESWGGEFEDGRVLENGENGRLWQIS